MEDKKKEIKKRTEKKGFDDRQKKGEEMTQRQKRN